MGRAELREQSPEARVVEMLADDVTGSHHGQLRAPSAALAQCQFARCSSSAL